MSEISFTTTGERLDHLATQYRESPNLKGVISTYLDAVDEIAPVLCDVFDRDIDLAVGDQLTQIGKVLGWDRLQCGGKQPLIFGFECETDDCTDRRRIVAGFCSNWEGDDCLSDELLGTFEFTDDELYRRFLKSMILKHDNDFRRSTLLESVKMLFGENASIYVETPGNVGISTGRLLTDDEQAVIHLIKQVLPVAPGVGVNVYETSTLAAFGFGEGWGGFCNGAFPTLIFSEGQNVFTSV